METRRKHIQEKRIESSNCLSGICYVPIIKVLVGHDGNFLFYGQNHSGKKRHTDKVFKIERSWLWLRKNIVGENKLYLSSFSRQLIVYFLAIHLKA